MGSFTFPLSQGDRLGGACSTTSSSISCFGEVPRVCPHVIRMSRTDGLNGTRSGRDTSRLLTSVSMMSRQFQKRMDIEEVKQLRLITAIKTPYLPDGRFDLEAFDDLVRQQVEHHVDGVIIGGTTGECQLMNWKEHIKLIAHTVHYFGEDIKVIGNTGSNSTREATRATEQGLHGSLQINPYYGKTSNIGVLAHFESVLPFGPTIIYNVPP